MAVPPFADDMLLIHKKAAVPNKTCAQPTQCASPFSQIDKQGRQPLAGLHLLCQQLRAAVCCCCCSIAAVLCPLLSLTTHVIIIKVLFIQLQQLALGSEGGEGLKTTPDQLLGLMSSPQQFLLRLPLRNARTLKLCCDSG